MDWDEYINEVLVHELTQEEFQCFMNGFYIFLLNIKENMECENASENHLDIYLKSLENEDLWFYATVDQFQSYK